jgi:4-amino-4-deoxy-L-arabinose transferase-like glycosyltransferase
VGPLESVVRARERPGRFSSEFRIALAVFAAALTLRLVFVAWSPGVPAADGFFYHQYGGLIASGSSYVNLDGSPAIRWMPGWPLLLGALYRIFGFEPKVAMFANALFDATTAGLLTLLGARLFGGRVGGLAGGIYALWPGALFYCGTVFTEPLFGALLTATLWLFWEATRAPGLAWPRFAAAGGGLGLCSLVKAEPLTLGPALLLLLWRTRRSRRGFALAALAAFGTTAALLAPWTIRNYLVFDRFILTSASGGIGAHLANHPGATGGQDFALNRSLQERYKGRNSAETSIKRNDAGFGDAWRFARDHPGEQLAIIANKFRITYGGDGQGLRTLRGSGPPARWHVAPDTWRRLTALADAYWFAVLALALAGLTTWACWPVGAGALVLGPVLTYGILHAIFLGGQRYHTPEYPSYALLAALGIERITTALRGRIRRPA